MRNSVRGIRIVPSITDRQDESLVLYFKDVAKEPMISADDEKELMKEIKQGNSKAIDKLVKANLRFVISVAKQYQNRGVPLVDLIQEGNIGLLRSIKLYDETKGFKFISYAVWWIRQAILKAISNQSRSVRIPTNQLVPITKINRISDKFEQLHDRRPVPEEIEEEIKLDVGKINDVLSYIGKNVSLDMPINQEDASSLLDVIPNNTTEPTDQYSERNDLPFIIENILKELPNRDSDVIRMAFGIGMYPMTNKEIGDKFGIGCERVRQIMHSTLKFIKENYFNDLKDLL